jgi:anti-sigma factor RsiW
MRFEDKNPVEQNSRQFTCEQACEEFDAYLDSAMSGVEMQAIAGHLEACVPCSRDFAELRLLQQRLGELGTATAPDRLQQQLQETLAMERERGTHLAWRGRILLSWKNWLAPLALRVSGGLAAALFIAGGLGWLFAAPLVSSVQANDENMAHLVAPRYLYSQVPAQPIETHHDVPVVVEALVDTQGRVYDYQIVAGPEDPAVKMKVEENLLASVFKPATAFGVPVLGQVVVTYAGVMVRG